MQTVLPNRFSDRILPVAIAVVALVCEFLVASGASARPGLVCESEAVLATGPVDPSLFAAEASKNVRAFWCERYDANGSAMRAGPYWEIYASGRTRTQALYVDSRLTGPVAIRNEDGSLFLRGFLSEGDWSGVLEIFHESGAVWFEARFLSGRLEGVLRTHFPDGALESVTRYQAGREDGLARSFYPTNLGGRLRSEAHVEADHLVGQHRLLSPEGDLIRSIDWSVGPSAWRSSRHNHPATADLTLSNGATTAPDRSLRD